MNKYTKEEKKEIKKQFVENWVDYFEIDTYEKTGYVSPLGTNKDMSQYFRTEKQIAERKKEMDIQIQKRNT